MSTTKSIEKAKPSQKLKVVDDKILKKTYFIPKQKMQNFLEKLDERCVNKSIFERKSKCSYNLAALQEARLGGDYKFETLWSSRRKHALFILSCYKAIYAHDWNKLLYLLKKVPYYQLTEAMKCKKFYNIIYPRLQMILLMFHPTAHETGALNDYLHMAWGCRTESEKKAVLKVLLTLRKKIPALGIRHQDQHNKI